MTTAPTASSNLDRIAWIKLTSVNLPLKTAVSDAKVLMEINALIDESNKKGQAVMAAQSKFMQVINGG